ncbi:LON peptidase substrate-binding domain-containing protein [Paracoccus sp. MBLB3053]|uniref:LON peptidase substrate-binding domain-containing protein n=1 Tax=Paracoccus aurantius TaxID=3073814 RepID=A0ABU2HR00_9RHOB|nr:LON peptidase substrate-binding domain-containing protein [Paracoccus sp. MBLB3053]MDS9466970.1 LON peptidase substrate-binding domain-containing protein [Paracoccus sp. MBLB3053]
MSRAAELPDGIPLFPLSGAILLPRTRLPLQIFEPRYLQMVEDVLKTPSRLIGMIQPVHPEGQRLAQIGCAGRIVAFSELDDNRLMISLKARSRFRLGRIEDGFRPYRYAKVRWTGFERDLSSRPETVEGFDRDALMARLARFARQRGLVSDWSSAESADEEALVNSLSMLLPFSTEEKQALLESPSLADRRELLDGLLEYALRGGDDEEIIQ